MVQSVPPSYEERYRWTRTAGLALAGCVAAMLLGILVAGMPVVLRIALAAVGAWGALFSIAVPVSRKVALRVDARGVTLGGGPFRYEATTRVFPWEEIERVVLWSRLLPFNARVRYVSVERRAGAPPLSPGGTGKADRPALYLSPDPQLPSARFTVGATRGMQAFRVDDDVLAAAITACAPSVPMIILG